MEKSNLRKRLIILGISIVLVLILLLVNRALKQRSIENAQTLPDTTQAISQASTAIETQSHTPTASQIPPSATIDTSALTATANAEVQATLDTAIQNATQRAVSMGRLIESLNRRDFLLATEGTYSTVKSFDESLAKSGWFQMWETEYDPEDFILRSDVIWTRAHEDDSLTFSGCGFVFSHTDPNNMFRIFLNLDGIVRVHRMADGEFEVIATDFYSDLEIPEGHAQFVLIVEDGWLSFLVNNNRLVHLRDENLRQGKLSFAIASGSNYSLGTRCQMNNVEMWLLPGEE